MIASVVLKQKMILDHNSFEMLNKIDEYESKYFGESPSEKKEFIKFLEFYGKLILINSYLISKKLLKKLYFIMMLLPNK